jgi:hypothetical protein
MLQKKPSQLGIALAYEVDRGGPPDKAIIDYSKE